MTALTGSQMQHGWRLVMVLFIRGQMHASFRRAAPRAGAEKWRLVACPCVLECLEAVTASTEDHGGVSA